MEGEFAIQFVIMLVFGGICASIASSRGRSPVGWFFIGLVAPCIGLILVLVLPDLKVEEDRRRRLVTENRRMREKLKKDRMVADHRHHETDRRLKAHDVALDIDTGPAQDRISAPADSDRASTQGPPELPRANAAAQSRFEAREWFYAEESQKSAPLTFAGMRRLWQKGLLDADTLVWAEGMTDWLPISDVENMEEALRA